MENIDPTVARASTTQIGAITEAMVSAQLMLVSGGRLSVYRPIADDDGIDLLVVDKRSGTVRFVQVKTWRATERGAPKTVQFDTRLATFGEARDGFLLAAIIDPQTGAIWRNWLIPFARLRSVANERNGILAIAPSPSLSSNDRYTPWRLSTLAETALRLTS